MSSIVTVIATRGRPMVCADAIESIEQSALPAGWRARGIVSVAESIDAPTSLPPTWRVIVGPAGLSAQRNTALNSLEQPADYVFFFDDDAIVRSDYLAAMIHYLESHPRVVAATGHVAADGAAEKREITLDEAATVLGGTYHRPAARTYDSYKQLYGCNFAIRWSALSGLRFDEAFPLYSWLEDHDFARRALRYGELSKVGDAVMVHRGSKSGGRTQHLRLGYSQVANPLWLMRKGSFPWHLALSEIARPAARNALESLVPLRRFDWRRQRLRGNLLACWDTLRNRGRSTPGRIEEFR